jgi:hypothetical protein
LPQIVGAQAALDERFIIHPTLGLGFVTGVEDTEPIADDDARLHEGPGREQRTACFQGIHVAEVVGNEGSYRFSRGNCAADGHEQRLLQHRREQRCRVVLDLLRHSSPSRCFAHPVIRWMCERFGRRGFVKLVTEVSQGQQGAAFPRQHPQQPQQGDRRRCGRADTAQAVANPDDQPRDQ